jgi:2,5-dioxopentanoate dehydrogenase
LITGKNYIGNKTSNSGSTTFKTFNPKENQENAWVFYEATSEEINTAVLLANKAFEKYSDISDKERAAFLREIANEIDVLGSILIETYTKESGLPEGRALGEKNRTLGQLRAFATLLEEGSWVDATIDTANPERQPLPKVDLRKMLLPLGPVAVFGSSNFPLAYSTAGGDTASALASGCPVIVKSHPMHAGTGELVASAIIKAAIKTNMPNGVFSNLNSSGIEVGEQLVMHPKVKAVGFTGSIKGGTALFQMASKRDEPIPVFAEMGSINPVVMLPSAVKNTDWAKQYAGSITLGAGQFCTNPGLILALKSNDLELFLERLEVEINSIEAVCMLHPNIHANFNNLKKEVSSQDAVSTVASNENDVLPNFAKHKVIKVSGKDFIKNSVFHKEVFGPFSVVVVCDNLSELELIISNLEGQLTGTILGDVDEIEKQQTLVRALTNRVGRVIFNGVPTGVEVCASMLHGGPFPASTDSRFSSVGTSAIKRWVRPVSFQNWPNSLLPNALKNENPLGILRNINGKMTVYKI